MSQPVEVAGVPLALRWAVAPSTWSGDGGALSITAGPGTDLFVDPEGADEPALNAPRLLGPLDGEPDFTLSARVRVGFSATYDAGALLVWAGERRWAKLCFERSPQGERMIVSVVTRGVSDDANAFVVAGDQAWLRVARLGRAYAFHASTDGRAWRFIRYFALGDGPERPALGFVAQSPTGDACTATFEHVRFARERLGNLRDGS